MAIIEVIGGPVTPRYLMRKTKGELVNLYMRMLRETARDAQDAARYRWLRGDGVPNHSARWARWEVRQWDGRSWTTHPDSIGPSLDHEIDAAKAREGEHD